MPVTVGLSRDLGVLWQLTRKEGRQPALAGQEPATPGCRYVAAA